MCGWGDAPHQYCQPQILKYVQDPERNLGLSPSQIHQDHAAQCQEECHDSQEECCDSQEVCCDGLELEQDHGKFQAVGDYHCHALLGCHSWQWAVSRVTPATVA